MASYNESTPTASGQYNNGGNGSGKLSDARRNLFGIVLLTDRPATASCDINHFLAGREIRMSKKLADFSLNFQIFFDNLKTVAHRSSSVFCFILLKIACNRVYDTNKVSGVIVKRVFLFPTVYENNSTNTNNNGNVSSLDCLSLIVESIASKKMSNSDAMGDLNEISDPSNPGTRASSMVQHSPVTMSPEDSADDSASSDKD